MLDGFSKWLNGGEKPKARHVPPAEVDPMGDGNLVAVRDTEGAQKMQDGAQRIGAEQIPVVQQQQQGGSEKKA